MSNRCDGCLRKERCKLRIKREHGIGCERYDSSERLKEMILESKFNRVVRNVDNLYRDWYRLERIHKFLI